MQASLAIYSTLIVLLLSSRVTPTFHLLRAALVTTLVARTLISSSYAGVVESLVGSLASYLRGPSLLELLTQLLAELSPYTRIFFGDVVGMLLLAYLYHQVVELYRSVSSRGLSQRVGQYLFNSVKWVPAIQKQLEKERQKLRDQLETDLKSQSRASAMKALTSLPVQGLSSDAVLAFLRGESEKDASVWKTGKVSGTVYCGDEAHHALLNAAFALYSVANPLHPETWPRSLRLEAEVVRMTASLVRGSCSTVCGSTTSGGTESIILAIKAHRDLYRERYGITRPEVVCCSSAHAAVDKGCDLMGIRLVKVPLDAEHCASISHIKSAINSNTVLLYASAPSYPQGTIDAVAAMSALAQRFGVGLHVDCCLGGFVLPFAKKLGYSLPEFDFSLPGVTSMSLDTHKYGCALKGSSVVLYRSPDLRQFQYFCVGDWSGGLYTTPTIAGSRSTGLIAQTWASLVAMGEEGYLELTAGIMETTRAIAAGVRAIPGLRVLGRAEAMIVCFTGDRDSVNVSVNVYRVGDCMRRRGWTLNSLQDPAAVHLCVTSCHVGLVDSFLADLAASVVEATGSGSGSAGAEGGSGSAAVYGATASLPAGPINELLRVYNDVVLQV